MTQSQKKGTALITGASSGIGAEYATRLAHQGYDLVLVARNRERLHTLASELTDATGREIATVVADLNNAKDLANVEQLLRNDQSITMLVNNAGVGAAAPLLKSDVDAMSAMIDLNVSALTRLAYAVAPRFVSQRGGTIVNISSIVGIAPEMLNGVYGASKAYVLAFTQSLQHELAEHGVRVQAVLPGATATGFWELAGMPIEHLPTDMVMTVTDTVGAGLAGLEQGEVITIPALPDVKLWDAYDSARTAMMPLLSRSSPAERYTTPA